MHNFMNNHQSPFCFVATFLSLIAITSFFAHASSAKVGETCSAGNPCDDGLTCGKCTGNGNTQPRCIRTKPIIPTTKVKGLPFNKYSWLTTHNSFAMRGNGKSGTGSILLTHTNQDDSITNQLNNGIRGLMLDMYDFNGDIWLCHSFHRECLNVTSFGLAINAMKEVRAFLEANPTEIVTLFLEDYVKTPNGLTKLFDAARLTKYRVPLSVIPKGNKDWPTVDEMVAKNHRLIIFTSEKSKEASEGIGYEWNYVVENQYGDEGMKPNTCPKSWRSTNLDDWSKPLVIMNFFRTNPAELLSCIDNSAKLMNMTEACFQASGKRWPNFIVVDFYRRSDGGGAAAAVDKANGMATCGCDSIAYCRANAKFGECEMPALPPPPPAALPPSAESAEPPQAASDGTTISIPHHTHWFVSTVLYVFLSLIM